MEFVQLNCCIFPKSTKAMRLFLILILIVLFSCQGEQTSSEKKNDSIARENIDSNRLAIDSVSRGYQLPQAYSGEEPEYKAISNPDLKSGMIVPDPFEPILALHAILPGNFKLEDNEYTDSRMELIWWNCPNCPKKKITYEYIGDDAYDFPFDDINTTLFTASFDLGEKENEKRLLVFNTYHDFYPEFVGRFSGGIMGLAMFTRDAKGWKLTNFSSALGEFGSFSSAFVPGIVRVGKHNWLFDCTYSNGGAGGAYTPVVSFYINKGKSFERVYMDNFGMLNNTSHGEWYSRIEAVDSMVKGYSDLHLITEGCFLGDGTDSFGVNEAYLWAPIPDELKEIFSTVIEPKNGIYFRMKRLLTYNGNYYELKKTEVKHEPYEGNPEGFQPSWVR
jgi:hypothetical protein